MAHRKLPAFILLIFTVTNLLFVYQYHESKPENTLSKIARLISSDNSIIEQPKPKKILIWNKYWGLKAVWQKIFAEILNGQCPQSNCILTTDRSEMETSDAILFHLVDVGVSNYSFPKRHNFSQIWIAMSYEPPYILEHTRAHMNFTELNGIFNRTMTYRWDSDITVRHGLYFPITPNMKFRKHITTLVDARDPISTRNYATGKKRLVSWFASSRNCQSSSGREIYVRELQKYIPVDVYGECGPYKCGVTKTLRYPYKVEHDDCYMMVSAGYKFVLAFENSLCTDYVTEKLYNHLRLNVIPIVFGGADYSKFAPPNSYIDAREYTPKQLADYMILLDSNDTLYNEYFAWKSQYFILSNDGVPLACDLCEQMHNPRWAVEKKVYDHFDTWASSGCSPGYKGEQEQL